MPRRPEYVYRTELVKNLDTLHTSQLGEISLLVNTILDEVSCIFSFHSLTLFKDQKDRENLSESIKHHLDPVKTDDAGSFSVKFTRSLLFIDGMYLYKFDNQWRIGRNYESKNCLA